MLFFVIPVGGCGGLMFESGSTFTEEVACSISGWLRGRSDVTSKLEESLFKFSGIDDFGSNS